MDVTSPGTFVVISGTVVVVFDIVVVADVVSSVVASEPKPSEVYLLWNYKVF